MLLPDLLNSQCQDEGMQNVNCSDSSVSQQGLPFHPVVMTMKGNEKYKMNWRLQHSLSISAVEELLVLGET